MMAIYNRMCWGGLGLVVLGLVVVCALGTGWAQQPLSLPDPPEHPSIQALPKALLPQAPSEDYKSDPLFQEIQRIVLQGETPASTGVVVGSPIPPKESRIDLISNDRWHAIESILAGARMLENEATECVRRSDFEGASKTQKAVKNLRLEAMELLGGS